MTGFQSPFHTAIPNDLFSEYLPGMGYAELKVVMVVCRETFGFHRDTFRLSIRKLATAAGLSARNAQLGAEAAVKRGLITQTANGGVTLWGVVVGRTTVVVGDTASVVAGDTVCMQGIQSVVAGDTPSIKEIEIKKIPRKKRAAKPESESVFPLMAILAEVCGMDIKLNRGMLAKHAKGLTAAGFTAERIKQAYWGDSSWWATTDWRGKQGQRPTISAINQTIKAATAPKPKLVIG